MMMLLELVSYGILLISLFIASLAFLLHSQGPSKRPSNPKVFAFFHPYCSGGGGGERVLWKLIQILQSHGKECVIYTIDPPDTDESRLRADAERSFNVQVPKPVRLVSLSEHQHCLRRQPFLSLVMESIGTMRLAYRALQKCDGIDVFLDTTGCAFTFWVVRFWWLPFVGGYKHEGDQEDDNTTSPWIVPYVHYPTISTDMMNWEATAHPDRPKWKTMLKLYYYRFFAKMYGWVGQSADLTMVNSTWTFNHINSLWNLSSASTAPPKTLAAKKRIQIVYPPCRVPKPDPQLVAAVRSPSIVSIGQFRPEKDHKLQIRALQQLLQHSKNENGNNTTINNVKLILIGSCRNDDDRGRVAELRALVKECNLVESVEFRINPPYEELQRCIQESSIGIHTMRQEHFGIGIVELMAAGLLVVAHNSGGPRTDIVHSKETGFLAVTVDEYAAALREALTMSEPEQQQMRAAAQASAQRFSDKVFDASVEHTMKFLL